ncbi:MAG: hypothetical protein AVDCRST_MAG93-6721 [uncultured Chloroflexia bacterium]|uniref:Uncharacterized protein n=1 Tax=uncultured Chloroflexia bacterium TaxID=1672391 RepID=A0A6J4LUV6_9CHLR|nr:MAG: hypothetical protein AVDCRST_MAG93-6721 [uncultured Chloroflexia bacterium]
MRGKGEGLKICSDTTLFDSEMHKYSSYRPVHLRRTSTDGMRWCSIPSTSCHR